MSRLNEEIARYPCRRSSTPIYKAPAADGQASKARFYFHGSLPNNLEITRNAIKLDLPTSISIHAVSNISLLKIYYGDQVLTKIV